MAKNTEKAAGGAVAVETETVRVPRVLGKGINKVAVCPNCEQRFKERIADPKASGHFQRCPATTPPKAPRVPKAAKEPVAKKK